jgi:hypothetical protein
MPCWVVREAHRGIALSQSVRPAPHLAPLVPLAPLALLHDRSTTASLSAQLQLLPIHCAHVLLLLLDAVGLPLGRRVPKPAQHVSQRRIPFLALE